jgi:hypothetical protein
MTKNQAALEPRQDQAEPVIRRLAAFHKIYPRPKTLAAQLALAASGAGAAGTPPTAPGDDKR